MFNELEKLLIIHNESGSKVQQLTAKFHHQSSLYNAAAHAGDGMASEKYRRDLHETLDELLDLTGSYLTILRKILELRYKLDKDNDTDF